MPYKIVTLENIEMSKKNEAKNHMIKAGEVVTKSVCFRKHLLEKLEKSLYEIKEESGYNPTRSKTLAILSEILITAEAHIDKHNIHDDASFKYEIVHAIKRL